jgi:hypothetical protein
MLTARYRVTCERGKIETVDNLQDFISSVKMTFETWRGVSKRSQVINAEYYQNVRLTARRGRGS